MKTSLWILEDEEYVQFLYKEFLENDFNIKIFSSLTQLKSALQLEPAKFLIADLRLPDGLFLDHFTNIDFPFIVVSSLEDLETLRCAFKAGAKDFLIKPFRKSELLAKLEAAISKEEKNNNQNLFPVQFLLELTKKEEYIIRALLISKDHSIKKDELTQLIWGSTAVGAKTIDVHLVNLRKKLEATNYTIETRCPGYLTLALRKSSRTDFTLINANRTDFASSLNRPS